MSSCRFISSNGIISPTDIPVSTFLESHPGAYTTTRTHNNGSRILFWDKHMSRLANSVRILYDSKPQLLFGSDVNEVLRLSGSVKSMSLELAIKSSVTDLTRKVLEVAIDEIGSGEELAVTTLVSGDLGKLSESDRFGDDEGLLSRALDVYVHAGTYVPAVFGDEKNCACFRDVPEPRVSPSSAWLATKSWYSAHLAVVGIGRDVAAAKYSEWVRLRKPLERLRSPSTTELLLSNDGDRLLEGCLTNLFVVCRTETNDNSSTCPFEVQTSPINDGVLPGVVRQLVIELCSSKGIPVREISPSWSQREMWQEAFITNSLRLVQHVGTIRAPKSWHSIGSKGWKDISWDEKHFQNCPGTITTIIQQAIMEEAGRVSDEAMSNFL